MLPFSSSIHSISSLCFLPTIQVRSFIISPLHAGVNNRSPLFEMEYFHFRTIYSLQSISLKIITAYLVSQFTRYLFPKQPILQQMIFLKTLRNIAWFYLYFILLILIDNKYFLIRMPSVQYNHLKLYARGKSLKYVLLN